MSVLHREGTTRKCLSLSLWQRPCRHVALLFNECVSRVTADGSAMCACGVGLVHACSLQSSWQRSPIGPGFWDLQCPRASESPRSPSRAPSHSRADVCSWPVLGRELVGWGLHLPSAQNWPCPPSLSPRASEQRNPQAWPRAVCLWGMCGNRSLGQFDSMQVGVEPRRG